MRKNTKKIVSATLGAAALLLVGGAIASANLYTANAETTEPEMKFAAYNLSLQDNIYIKFALSLDGVTKENVKVLVWEGEAPQDYTYGTQSSVLSSDETTTKDGVTYPVYKFTELSASEMTTEVYACAYAEVGGVEYYSEPVKYSILEYAYNKLGKTEAAATTEENLPELLEAMLNYGAAAQKYSGVNPDRLANEAYTYVSVANATFEDGFNYGFFKAGEQVVVTPNDGYSLSAYATAFSENEETGEIVLTVPSGKFIDENSFTDGTETIPDKPEEPITYTFSDYTAGVQYDKEMHVLDEHVTVTTADCHFTSELRIYSSSTNNGNAIIESKYYPITGISFDAGYKNDTLNVYGSEDGVTWTLIEGVEVTSGYGNVEEVKSEFAYKYLKLDVDGTQQVRLKSMTLDWSTDDTEEEPTAADKVAYEEEHFALETTEVEGVNTISLPTNGTKYTDVAVSWALAEGTDEALATLEDNVLNISNPEADTTLTVYATFTCDGESSAQVEFEITVKHVDETETPDPETPTTKTETIAIADFGYANALDFPESKKGDITISASKGSGQTPPKYYISGAALRMYANNTITISCAEGYKIKSVTFTTASSSYTVKNATITNGELSGQTVTATDGVNSVTLLNRGSDQWRITGITVEYEAI